MKAPDFLKKPSDTTTPQGQDAVFEVEVDGEPLPEVKWYAYRVSLATSALIMLECQLSDA